MLILFPLAALFFLVFSLYEKGILALQSKSALFFSASVNGGKAKFSRCTGRIMRILRFKTNAPVRIVFERDLSQGSASFDILERKAGKILVSDEREEYIFTPEASKRYKLTVYLKQAAGNYEMRISRMNEE